MGAPSSPSKRGDSATEASPWPTSFAPPTAHCSRRTRTGLHRQHDRPESPMSLAIIMKVEGVSGTSTIQGHQGEIPVTGFRWGAARNLDPRTGLPVGKPLPDVVTVTKRLDQTTTALGRRAVDRT